MEILIGIKKELPEDYHKALLRCVEKCKNFPEAYLFSACEKHVKDAEVAFKSNPVVDFETAQKLSKAFAGLKTIWDDISEEGQICLKAAMYYYALDEDDEPDLESMLGFDDDVAIANACIRAAGKDAFIIDLKRH
ncbi:MAG: hypothetical protein NE328_24330 [Lentisphaeraceae bacterium]|nr:hypothetical protein [Lentisphaeraceae bacterium]